MARTGRMIVNLVCFGADPSVPVVTRAPTNRGLAKVTDSPNIGLLHSTCCYLPEVTCASDPLHSVAIVYSILSKTERRLKIIVFTVKYFSFR
jgi:hypothetical protein